MNHVIYKYPVPMGGDRFKLEIPKHSQFLALKMQKGEPQIWFLVDSRYQKEERFFRLIGTGIPFEKGLSYNYLGTFLSFEDSLVLHLFEHKYGDV